MRFLKLIAGAAAAAGLCAAFSLSAAAESDIVSVSVDNDLVTFDQPPIIVDPGYTMVPIRAVFEKAGAEVDWDQESQTAIIKKNDITVTIKIGDTAMYRNGTRIELDAPAMVTTTGTYRTLIPVRAIAEAMDYAVTWDGHHSLVLVSTNGKPYRPYAFIKKGFRTLEDAAEFYAETPAKTSIDLDNDGKPEELEFTPTNDASGNAKVLTINGLDYTASLGSVNSARSIAFVDLDDTDNSKELIVSENGDVLTAHFYSYRNGIMSFVSDGTQPAEVSYRDKLLISGKSYVLSDLYGTCFTDIMVSGGMHVYQSNQGEADKVLRLTKFQSISNIFGRSLYRTYDDDMLYRVIYSQTYHPGTYMYVSDTGIIGLNELEHFKLLDGFISDEDKTYIELFVELPNGETAVLIPYKI